MPSHQVGPDVRLCVWSFLMFPILFVQIVGALAKRPGTSPFTCVIRTFTLAGSIIQMSRDMTKPTKWLCAQRRLRSAWASSQSALSLRCPHKKPWDLNYTLSAHRRLGSDWVDAQADPSLCWVHTHFVGFVMMWLKYPVNLLLTQTALIFRPSACFWVQV